VNGSKWKANKANQNKQVNKQTKPIFRKREKFQKKKKEMRKFITPQDIQNHFFHQTKRQLTLGYI
jgi:mevalonate pyrophosphate decarboxylase